MAGGGFNRFSPERELFHVFPHVFHEVFPKKSDFFAFVFKLFRKSC